jgi:hypothetical protein
MPFGKHHIHPAQVEAMRSAFHKVCDALMLGCDGDDPMTEIIVTKIVALAKSGEHDASRLVELVLHDVADGGLPTASKRRASSLEEADLYHCVRASRDRGATRSQSKGFPRTRAYHASSNGKEKAAVFTLTEGRVCKMAHWP